jgi:hypothetical protein
LGAQAAKVDQTRFDRWHVVNGKVSSTVYYRDLPFIDICGRMDNTHLNGLSMLNVEINAGSF